MDHGRHHRIPRSTHCRGRGGVGAFTTGIQGTGGQVSGAGPDAPQFTAARVLAECSAKRKILGNVPLITDISAEISGTSEYVLMCLDSVYSQDATRLIPSKPLVRRLSRLLKTAFSANHRWAMARGQEALTFELRRRPGTDHSKVLRPAPTFASRYRWPRSTTHV